MTSNRSAIARVVSLCLVPLILVRATSLRADADLQSLADAGHWKRLRAIVEPRATNDASDAPAAYYLSRAELAFGNLEHAIAFAERAISLDQNRAAYHAQLAKVCFQEADTASVLKVFSWIHRFEQEAQAAIQLDPANLDARLSLMAYRWDHREIDKALALADEIGRIDPAEGALARADLARRQNAKDWTVIEGWARKATDAAPNNYRAHVLLATTLAAADPAKSDEAIAEARKAQAIDPGRVAAYVVLARVYATQHDAKTLDATLALAEHYVSDNLWPFFQAGLTLQQQGLDTARAEVYLRKYLSQEPEAESPKPSRAYWRLGLVLEQLGRKDEAISEVERAVKLEPDFAPAKSHLKRLKGGTR